MCAFIYASVVLEITSRQIHVLSGPLPLLLVVSGRDWCVISKTSLRGELEAREF